MLLVLNLIGKFPFLMLWNIKYEKCRIDITICTVYCSHQDKCSVAARRTLQENELSTWGLFWNWSICSLKNIYLISMSESSDDTQLPQTNVTLPEHKSKYWNTESQALKFHKLRVYQMLSVINVLLFWGARDRTLLQSRAFAYSLFTNEMVWNKNFIFNWKSTPRMVNSALIVLINHNSYQEKRMNAKCSILPVTELWFGFIRVYAGFRDVEHHIYLIYRWLQ